MHFMLNRQTGYRIGEQEGKLTARRFHPAGPAVQYGCRGYSLLNFAFHSPKAQSAVLPHPKWRRQLEIWRKLLAQCARKPSRRSVHALRSLTLRLQVGLEYFLSKQAANPAAARAFQHWCKDGKKLRKALEPVRDADVHLARLDSLRGTGASKGKQHLSPRCIREIDKLKERLRRRRKAGINKLIVAIDARGKRLNRSSKELEAALAPHMPSKLHSTAPEALRIYTELNNELPNLDAGNMHEYRKRLKQARYLAEISAAADPLAKRLAAAFRRIHYAAGEWHDWQELLRKAGHILPGHGEQDGLIPVLEALAETALHRALGQCRRTAARFLKNVGYARPLPPRKPVASEPGFQSEDINFQAATR
jgi:CHAD domain-containing protein